MKLYLIIIFNIIYFILLLFIYLYLVKHLKCNQIEYFQNKTNKPKIKLFLLVVYLPKLLRNLGCRNTTFSLTTHH